MEILTHISGQYEHATTGWIHYLFPVANKIFATLAMIEIAWAGCWWAIEKKEMTSLLAEFLNKIIILGLFYALLINANHWIPDIIKSFMLLGAGASKTGHLYPSDIFEQGIGIATHIISLLSLKEDFLNTFASVSLYITSYVVIFCYTLIAAQILIAQIETYIVISAGILLLSFSANRITRSISVNYFSYAINLGIRLFILFLIVGIGCQITLDWLNLSQKSILNSPQASFEILGGSVIFLCIVWIIPKRTQGLMTGFSEVTHQADSKDFSISQCIRLIKSHLQKKDQNTDQISIKNAVKSYHSNFYSSQSILKQSIKDTTN